MTDQGAIESIAKAHAAHVVYYGTPEAKCVCGWKGEDGDVHLAEVSLDALAADGYRVLKAELKPKPTHCPGTVGSRPYWMGVDQYDPCPCILPPGHEGKHACAHDVPEGSEDEQ